MSGELEFAMLHLADQDEYVREAAHETLRSNPQGTLEYLLDCLRSNPAFHLRALRALKCVDDNLISVLPDVLPFLQDFLRPCRVEALELIVKMGPAAKAAVPELLRVLMERDEGLQTIALKCLVQIGLGPEDSGVLVPLGRMLRRYVLKEQQGSYNVVRQTVSLLQSLGQRAVPTLIACLRMGVPTALTRDHNGDEDFGHFTPIFEALQKLLPQSKGAAQKLLNYLHLEYGPRGFRKDILITLGCVGPADTACVVNALVDLYTDGDFEELYETMSFAIHRIGLPAIPVFLEMLKDPDESRSSCAAYALGGYNDPDNRDTTEALEKAARAAIPELIAAFVAGECELKEGCAYALGTMGPDAKDALPALNNALNDRFPSIRKAAAAAIALINQPSNEST